MGQSEEGTWQVSMHYDSATQSWVTVPEGARNALARTGSEERAAICRYLRSRDIDEEDLAIAIEAGRHRCDDDPPTLRAGASRTDRISETRLEVEAIVGHASERCERMKGSGR